jgi:hypothetical protein
MDANGQRLIAMLGGISAKARRGDYNGAFIALSEGIPLIQEALQQGSGSAGFAAFGPRIAYSLETLLLMLEQKDWVAIADIIDFEFVALWKEAFP